MDSLDTKPPSGSRATVWLVVLFGVLGIVGVQLVKPPPTVAFAPVHEESSLRVQMYSTSWCGYCRAARAWLSTSGIPYDDHDVEHDRAAQARMREINPGGGVPTFDVDGQIAMGFDQRELGALVARAASRRALR